MYIAYGKDGVLPMGILSLPHQYPLITTQAPSGVKLSSSVERLASSGDALAIVHASISDLKKQGVEL